MSNQLSLITPTRRWRLDPRTRQRGLYGVATARAILAESRVNARETALSETTLSETTLSEDVSHEIQVADAA